MKRIGFTRKHRKKQTVLTMVSSWGLFKFAVDRSGNVKSRKGVRKMIPITLDTE